MRNSLEKFGFGLTRIDPFATLICTIKNNFLQLVLSDLDLWPSGSNLFLQLLVSGVMSPLNLKHLTISTESKHGTNGWTDGRTDVNYMVTTQCCLGVK